MTPKKNQQEEGVLDALGIPSIEVSMPCSSLTCLHSIEDHQNKHGEPIPCGGVHKTVDKDTKRETGEHVPCECQAFEGGFPDGSPRGVKLRQLTPPEWEMLSQESTMPIRISLLAPDAMPPEDYLATYKWMGKVVRAALIYVRNWDKQRNVANWVPVKVVPEGAHPSNPWECTLEQLDRGGTANIPVMANAVIADLRMLPPGVEVVALEGATFPGDGDA